MKGGIPGPHFGRVSYSFVKGESQDHTDVTSFHCVIWMPNAFMLRVIHELLKILETELSSTSEPINDNRFTKLP